MAVCGDDVCPGSGVGTNRIKRHPKASEAYWPGCADAVFVDADYGLYIGQMLAAAIQEKEKKCWKQLSGA